MKIAVLYSLPTSKTHASAFAAQDDETKIVAEKVAQALQEKKANVKLMGINEHSIKSILKIKADCIFNLIEWTGLEIGLTERAFECIKSLQIPYTGATEENYLLTSDKVAMKKTLDMLKLPTAMWQSFLTGDESVRRFSYPVIVKPALEHCSVGISNDSIADDAADLVPKVRSLLKKFTQPILVEEFLDGREFQATLIEINGRPHVLPIEEVVYDNENNVKFLTFDGKWNSEHDDYKSVEIEFVKDDDKLRKKIEKISLKAFDEMKFRGYARFDIRMKNNKIYFLETNANPNLYDPLEAGSVSSYQAAGMTFADFIWNIVESACNGKYSGY